MRRFNLAVFVLILLAACNNDQGKKKDSASGFPPAAPGSADETPAAKSSSDEEEKPWSGGFNIDAPDGWTKSDTFLMGNNITFLQSPEEENDDFLENINVIKENVGNASLEEYYEKSHSVIKDGLRGFEAGESSNKVINGIEFKNLKYTHNYNGMLLDVDLYLAIHKKTGFVITCSAKKGKLSEYQPAFDQALKSFSFK